MMFSLKSLKVIDSLIGTVLHKRLVTAVQLTLQHPLEKAHVVASSSDPFTNNIQDSGAYKHKLFLDIIFFLKKYLRQTSIDFDFCNLSSSGDVVYKER